MIETYKAPVTTPQTLSSMARQSSHLPLFSWQQDSIDGYIQSLLSYTQESLSLLNSFDVSPALLTVASLIPSLSTIRTQTFLALASHRTTMLLTLAVSGADVLVGMHTVMQAALDVHADAAQIAALQCATQLVQGIAAAVSTYLKRTSEVCGQLGWL